MEPMTTRHIETDPDKCGGKPTIAGTRIRVWDIHAWHHLRGESPEQIVCNFPELSVADVHAALAYYLDNQEAIDRQMQDSKSFAESVENEQGPTRFSRLRDEILQGRDAEGDSIPS